MRRFLEGVEIMGCEGTCRNSMIFSASEYSIAAWMSPRAAAAVGRVEGPSRAAPWKAMGLPSCATSSAAVAAALPLSVALSLIAGGAALLTVAAPAAAVPATLSSFRLTSFRTRARETAQYISIALWSQLAGQKKVHSYLCQRIWQYVCERMQCVHVQICAPGFEGFSSEYGSF